MDNRFLQEGVDKKILHAAEECCELGAALMKAARWGLNSVNPLLPPEQQETNRDWIFREMKDVRATLDRLEQELIY
jgi:hypothetical protein